MEDVTYTLYKVAKCGFYEDEDTHLFGTVFQLMEDFRTWAGGLDSIGESSTYTPTEDDDFLRAFCLDVRRIGRSNHWMISTWNELATADGGVQLVAADSKIGSPTVSAVELDGVSLPGYPAFFLIDTRQKLVLNIRFDQRLNGSRQLQRYLQEFLRSSSKWCKWDDDGTELLGYEYDGEVLDDVEPIFRTSMRRVATSHDEIRARVNDIRKVIKRASVSPQVEQERPVIDTVFSVIGLPKNNRLRADIPFHIEMKAHLNIDKLDAIIEKYELDAGRNGWVDVGVTFAKESQKIHWLSGALAREKASIAVDRLESGMIDLDSLEEFLSLAAEGILETLSRD